MGEVGWIEEIGEMVRGRAWCGTCDVGLLE